MRKLLFIYLMFALASFSSAALAQKAFTNDDLASDAIRLEDQIKKDAAPLAARTPDQLRKDAQAALARKDITGAAKNYAAILIPNIKDAQAWLTYSRALLAASDSYSWSLNATTAAYIAYPARRDETGRSGGARRLGEVYAKREIWRPSLNAYRASLDLVDLPGVRKIYTKEREKYGFRILDYKVDKDSAAPRACFQFSDPLARGKRRFRALCRRRRHRQCRDHDRRPAALRRRPETWRALCHRAAPGPALGGRRSAAEMADYEIYVRDRSPQVHFTGKNYVLPRVGQEGIPGRLGQYAKSRDR